MEDNLFEMNDDLIDMIPNEEDKKFVMSCYIRKSNGEYKLKQNLSKVDKQKLVSILLSLKFNKEKGIKDYYINSYSKYFFEYRQYNPRKADQDDDYYKGQYLYYLNEYLCKKKKGYPLNSYDDPNTKKVVCEVYKIFDYAYFLKIGKPGDSDMTCFDLAERKFSDNKAIDYDAYQIYLDRTKKGLSGNAETDYINAEKSYYELHPRKNII